MLNLIFCGNMSHHVKMRNHILGERESFMTKQKGFKRNCSFAFLCMKGKIEEKERHQCPCHQSTEFLDGWDPFDKRLFSTSLLPMLPTYPSILIKEASSNYQWRKAIQATTIEYMEPIFPPFLLMLKPAIFSYVYLRKSAI
jgi:hypothetical protein